uniref:PGR5-like protein 1A, chloroplastic n=1 Tax=Oryza punctata TaxID=4537 RepID=A0A0E0LTN0_ORYPU
MASLLPRPVLPAAAAASTSSSSRCRCRIATSSSARGLSNCQGWRLRHRVWAAQGADQQGGLQQQQQQQQEEKEDDVVDSNVLPYCSIKRKEKKTIGEMEQEFLQALQARALPSPLAFYYDKKAVMSNEEFDNLKEELMWEGSSVVMLSPDEQRLLEASMAYVAGNPIMTDAEFDELKLRLRVYSDLTVDYFKMFLLNVPAAVVALTLFLLHRFFFLDDLTGFEITYLLELPEPFSFIFTWFAALPLIFWVAQAITSAIVKDFLILKGPCPNCGNENLSFFGTILSVPSGGARNSVKCANCGSSLVYDSASRLITLPETAEA